MDTHQRRHLAARGPTNASSPRGTPSITFPRRLAVSRSAPAVVPSLPGRSLLPLGMCGCCAWHAGFSPPPCSGLRHPFNSFQLANSTYKYICTHIPIMP